MIDEDIKKYNEMIADFMGYDRSEHGYFMNIRLPQFRGSDHGEWCVSKDMNDETYWIIGDGNLRYDTSWDWLMTIVKKIQTDCHLDVIISLDMCVIRKYKGISIKGFKEIGILNSSSITAVWLAVIEYIKWYNENIIKN